MDAEKLRNGTLIVGNLFSHICFILNSFLDSPMSKCWAYILGKIGSKLLNIGVSKMPFCKNIIPLTDFFFHKNVLNVGVKSISQYPYFTNISNKKYLGHSCFYSMNKASCTNDFSG